VTSTSLCEAILEREAQETRDCTDIYREIERDLTFARARLMAFDRALLRRRDR
jgi:hypothetical protein